MQQIKEQYKTDLFFQSRVKLTFLLVILFMPIVFLATTLVTYIFYSQINQEYDFLSNGPMMIGPGPMNDPKRLEKIEEIIQRKVLAPIDITTKRVLPLVYILDMLFVLTSAFLFYMISGKIQRPIQNYLSLSKNFVSQASHELKTPLTIISSEVSLAENLKEINPAVSKSIKEEVERINNISSDLLHINRLSEDENYKKVWINLSNLLSEIITTSQKYASLKNQQIDISSNPEINVFVNESDIKIAIRNILKNASDFSPTNSKIQIISEVQGSEVKLQIKDSGKGMDLDTLVKVTEPFFKSRLPEDGAGHGLGLHLVTRICQKNNIQFLIESKLNEGTIVTLTFKGAENI